MTDKEYTAEVALLVPELSASSVLPSFFSLFFFSLQESFYVAYLFCQSKEDNEIYKLTLLELSRKGHHEAMC
jgi:hypothetical protein